MAKKSSVRIEVTSASVVAILNSSEVRADLNRRGSAVHGALPTGDGEEWDQLTLQSDRPSVMVRAANHAARKAAAEDLALLRAINAGR